eukprot:SAG31_NODE_2053_length_6551_cov_7.496125_3_plen_157_part_00
MSAYADAIAPMMRYLLLVKLFLMLFILSHFLGCLLYSIGDSEEKCSANRLAIDPNCLIYGWVRRDDDYTAGWVFTDENGTVVLNDSVGTMYRYVTSFYLTISDFAVEFAFTRNEKIWVSCQHILYEAFMAYLTGVFAVRNECHLSCMLRCFRCSKL